MTARRIEPEQTAGLVVAALAHAGLLAFLVLRPPTPQPVPPVERVTVTLANDVGLTESAPSQAEPAPAMAPDQGEAAPPPAPEPAPAPPQPQAEAKIEPQPAPRPAPPAKVVPQPRPTPQPRPVTAAVSEPAPALPRQVPQTRPAPRSATTAPPLPRQVTSKSGAQPVPRQASAATSRTTPAAQPGARSFSDAFRNMGNPAQGSGTASTPRAALSGPQKAALIGAISREIRPHWRAPEGLEAERLVTYVSFSLNRDGTIAGTPTTRQEGVTDANRAQAPRHAEQAIRAIRLAAPFDLPPDLYDNWKRVIDFRFDRRLAQ